MQRKDLIFADEASGRRQVTPLTASAQQFVISGRDEDAFTLPNLATGIAAVITADHEVVTIQAANRETQLFINQSPVHQASRTLAPGDLIRIGGTAIAYMPTETAHRVIALADAPGDGPDRSDQTTPPGTEDLPAVTPVTFQPRMPPATARRRRGG
ncbi:MAG: hypothetical protein JJV98_18605, partial [Desulfosarcina sp.]|nr:hypothetical protein [Desulfobacterales bacterium]